MSGWANTRLGRYEIREPLGKGGMGEVYLAYDTRLKRELALKILQERFTADEICLARFRQEAFAASALNHPNILTVYDIDIVAGTHIIATELVEGETLRKRLSRGLLGVPEALAISVQICDALSAAHRAGVVHRDIKPENIMLRADRYVKLLDFGIAKLIGGADESALQTVPGTIFGTPQYMSPEQARGEQVDVRTDVWSLGVVLYEMLAGHPPFTGSNVRAVIKAILENEPTPISADRQEVSPELNRVVMTMLSKDVARRDGAVANFMPLLKRLLDFTGPVSGSHSGYTTIRTEEEPALLPRQPPKTLRKSRVRKVINSLAILPFVNASMDPKAEYLSDGITENIINNLSQLPQLRVLSRGSVFRFKGKEHDPQVVGRDLGVAAIVTGKLLRVGTKLVIQAELVAVEDGVQLWGENYNQRVSDIFKIQSNIAREISDKLQLKLTVPQKNRLMKRQPADEEAYLSYLRGRFHWNKRSPEGLNLSIQCFNDAIERNPSYALAYAGLADTYVVLGHQHLMVTSDAYSRAKAAAFKALGIDDTLAEAYTTLGFIKGAFDLDWVESEKAFKKAIKLNPGYATAHQWYSVILRAMGRMDEAISEALVALQLDPLSTSINVNVASCLHSARRYEEAIDRYRRISAVETGFFWTHYGLALVYRKQGRHREAIIELKQAMRLTSDRRIKAVLIADLVYSYGMSGLKEKATRMMDQLSEIARVTYVSPCDMAVAHLGLGDKATVFQLLEKAYEARDEGLMWLKIEPVFDELRSDPKFLDLLVRVGLEPLS